VLQIYDIVPSQVGCPL